MISSVSVFICNRFQVSSGKNNDFLGVFFSDALIRKETHYPLH